MVVHDLDLQRTVAGPTEANPVPLIDPDAVLALAVAGQRFEPIPRRNPKLFQALHGIELVQLPAGHGPQLTRTAPAGRLRVAIVKYVFRALVRIGITLSSATPDTALAGAPR